MVVFLWILSLFGASRNGEKVLRISKHLLPQIFLAHSLQLTVDGLFHQLFTTSMRFHLTLLILVLVRGLQDRQTKKWSGRVEWCDDVADDGLIKAIYQTMPSVNMWLTVISGALSVGALTVFLIATVALIWVQKEPLIVPSRQIPWLCLSLWALGASRTLSATSSSPFSFVVEVNANSDILVDLCWRRDCSYDLISHTRGSCRKGLVSVRGLLTSLLVMRRMACVCPSLFYRTIHV